LAFLKAALGPLWTVLDVTATSPMQSKPSDVLATATKQAAHTGWLGDTGSFDIDEAAMWIRMGGQENMSIVLRQLYTTDPDTRARLLMQMEKRDLLHTFCKSFGWKPIKELHDSLGGGFPEIKTYLQNYFIGGKDLYGPSLDSEWETHDNSVHHHLGRVPGVGGALNFVADLATFGFNSSYGKSRDAFTEGEISSSEYADSKRHLVNRTVAMGLVSVLTGGMADKFVRGGAAAVTTARAIGAGFAGGSVGSVAGLATSDAYNVYISGEQDGFSSPIDYLKAALIGGGFGGAMGGLLNGMSPKAKGFIPEEAVVADEAASVAAGESPYRALENPRVAQAAQRAGVPPSALSDVQIELMAASERAIAEGNVHEAAKIGDELIASGMPKEAVVRFEDALAKDAGKTSPDIYRNPRATLPDGKSIEPSVQGGELHYGTDSEPPSVVFEKGLSSRGPNVSLTDHVAQGGDSAFRGTTRTPMTQNGEAGAGQWAGENGWVYKIDGTPSWDLNAELQGRVPKPDGTYGDNPLPGEHEQAVLAGIPKERIVGAYKMMVNRRGQLVPGEFTPNPNYRPIR
ncbi:MAG: hypothetical protein ABI647_27200, partial [Gemmatimonadota bacterium]